MAREHSERGRRSSRGENEAESDRHNERQYRRPLALNHDHRRSRERHWRGHDHFDRDDEFERGRDHVAYDRERAIAPEPRRPSLPHGHDERYDRRDHVRPYQSREGEFYRDDDRGGGPYVGRGPKGYRRSDERILEDVCERLTNHPRIDASDIEVKVSGGEVILTGRIESRTVKHLTENMVETVSGVKEVHNQLRVTPPPDLSQDWQEPRERRATDPSASKTRRR